MTRVKPECFCAAFEMARAWLLLFNSPQNRRSPTLVGIEGKRGLATGNLDMESSFYLSDLTGHVNDA